jgi:hypothetical protein
MDRAALLRHHDIKELKEFLAAIDRLLAGPGLYFDPGILPDPASPDDFCARYQALRDRVADDFGGTVSGELPTRRFSIRRGPSLPVGGCLLREDIESMRADVEACLAVLRRLSAP